jgi:hypothetical protein
MTKYTITTDDINEKVFVNIEANQNGKYNVLVIGTRKDIEAINSGFELEKQHPERLTEIMDRCHTREMNCKYCTDCCN